ncbi:MAG: CBS domain-containing protein [Chloroflexota bacterium]|nr:CBS domain-containing protein [Chloroflexota bacterium]
MPYQVKHLMSRLSQPVTTRPEELIKDVVARMIQYNFSQLPVFDSRTRQFYLITNDSIIKAFFSFGVNVKETPLTVANAMSKVNRLYREDDDLFEIMEGIRDRGAALIVGDSNELLHIVTSYDTTEYFRRKSEDLMYARDIEDTLKRYITTRFKNPDGSIDEQARQKLTDELASPNRIKKAQFEMGLQHYLKLLTNSVGEVEKTLIDQAFGNFLRGSQVTTVSQEVTRGNNDAGTLIEQTDSSIKEPKDEIIESYNTSSILLQRFETALSDYLKKYLATVAKLNPDRVKEAFDKVSGGREKPLNFLKDLNLNNYIDMFLNEKCWELYKSVFTTNQNEIRNMLEGVRTTRNKLAHFREEEITELEQSQLKTCVEWLDTHKSLLDAHLEKRFERDKKEEFSN